MRFKKLCGFYYVFSSSGVNMKFTPELCCLVYSRIFRQFQKDGPQTDYKDKSWENIECTLNKLYADSYSAHSIQAYSKVINI